MMILYRALQPLLLATFGVLATILRLTPGLNEKTRKLWTTWEIRYPDGRPAFFALDRGLLKNQSPIWIHAASGEFEYAKPVIRELQKISDVPILITYFSPTYAENVRKFPGVTLSCPLPLDSRDELESFLDFFKPRALLIARTDAWPNTVTATANRGVPILLFSATFHEESKRLNGLGKHLTQQTLKQISLIQCVSQADVEILHSIAIDHAEVVGDSRYDQVLARLAAVPSALIKGTLNSIRNAIQPRALIAGSVWIEDVGPLVKASKATAQKHPHTLILVPHEISETFLREIESLCLAAGFEVANIVRLSRLASARSQIDVLVVDSVGLLAELYQLGNIAFVGGSFRKSVHSVMEPLAAGCLTVVGPQHLNNREAIEFQAERNSPNGPSYVTAVSDLRELTEQLFKLWVSTENVEFKPSIRQAVAKRGGATAQILRWLKEMKLI